MPLINKAAEVVVEGTESAIGRGTVQKLAEQARELLFARMKAPTETLAEVKTDARKGLLNQALSSFRVSETGEASASRVSALAETVPSRSVYGIAQLNLAGWKDAAMLGRSKNASSVSIRQGFDGSHYLDASARIPDHVRVSIAKAGQSDVDVSAFLNRNQTLRGSLDSILSPGSRRLAISPGDTVTVAVLNREGAVSFSRQAGFFGTQRADWPTKSPEFGALMRDLENANLSLAARVERTEGAGVLQKSGIWHSLVRKAGEDVLPMAQPRVDVGNIVGKMLFVTGTAAAEQAFNAQLRDNPWDSSAFAVNSSDLVRAHKAEGLAFAASQYVPTPQGKLGAGAIVYAGWRIYDYVTAPAHDRKDNVP